LHVFARDVSPSLKKEARRWLNAMPRDIRAPAPEAPAEMKRRCSG
jgi:hypothetical protein